MFNSLHCGEKSEVKSCLSFPFHKCGGLAFGTLYKYNKICARFPSLAKNGSSVKTEECSNLRNSVGRAFPHSGEGQWSVPAFFLSPSCYNHRIINIKFRSKTAYFID